MNQIIPICFIFDKNYIMPTCVAITSMLINREKDTKYHVILIGVGCENEDLSKVEELKNKFENIELTIKFADISRYNSIAQRSHVAPAALVKFELGELIQEYDRLLFIDGDVIVRKDLTEFYNIELGNNILAGPLDTVDIVRHNNQVLTGAFLLDSKKMREINAFDKLSTYRIGLGQRKSMDGTTFNDVLGNLMLHISIKYDLPIRKLYYERKFYTIKDINAFYGTNYKSRKQMINDAVIVHYDGARKPWLYSCFEGTKLWDFYYKLSPFGKEKLKRKNYVIYLLDEYKMNGVKGLYYIAKDKVRELFGNIVRTKYSISDWN